MKVPFLPANQSKLVLTVSFSVQDKDTFRRYVCFIIVVFIFTYLILLSKQLQSYESADVCILLFSIINPRSFQRITTHWAPGESHFSPHTLCHWFNSQQHHTLILGTSLPYNHPFCLALQEVARRAPDATKILVGTKLDMLTHTPGSKGIATKTTVTYAQVPSLNY